jgi:hypothetical protein
MKKSRGLMGTDFARVSHPTVLAGIRVGGGCFPVFFNQC